MTDTQKYLKLAKHKEKSKPSLYEYAAWLYFWDFVLYGLIIKVTI